MNKNKLNLAEWIAISVTVVLIILAILTFDILATVITIDMISDMIWSIKHGEGISLVGLNGLDGLDKQGWYVFALIWDLLSAFGLLNGFLKCLNWGLKKLK